MLNLLIPLQGTSCWVNSRRGKAGPTSHKQGCLCCPLQRCFFTGLVMENSGLSGVQIHLLTTAFFLMREGVKSLELEYRELVGNQRLGRMKAQDGRNCSAHSQGMVFHQSLVPYVHRISKHVPGIRACFIIHPFQSSLLTNFKTAPQPTPRVLKKKRNSCRAAESVSAPTEVVKWVECAQRDSEK
ncbi:uncharacterized protein LOC143693419 [Agelaius phoeniceus]|uniref:uncharacterized protein LOC143693419 n=1 Tax=Agelaius phoeniceus TaxID=39638 RepID=UPI004054F43D